MRPWKVGALFMEAGTGKTKVARDLIATTDADVCLWIAPLRTLDNARRELDKWGGLSMCVKFVGVESLSQSSRIYLDAYAFVEEARLRELFSTKVDEGKSIIFCKYIDSRKFCEKAFPKAKVLSYQKEAFGLNLQEYTNTIYFDKTFDWAMREQASRRTFRVGQEYDCRYYDLTGNAGLDKIIDKNIDKKIGMVEYFKGKTKEQIKQEL